MRCTTISFFRNQTACKHAHRRLLLIPADTLAIETEEKTHQWQRQQFKQLKSIVWKNWVFFSSAQTKIKSNKSYLRAKQPQSPVTVIISAFNQFTFTWFSSAARSIQLPTSVTYWHSTRQIQMCHFHSQNNRRIRLKIPFTSNQTTEKKRF